MFGSICRLTLCRVSALANLILSHLAPRFFLSLGLSALGLSYLITSTGVLAAQIALAWDAIRDPNLAGYIVYYGYLKLTAFSGGDRVNGLTIAAGEAILHGSRTSVLISRLPAGAGGLPHVPHHTRSRRSGQLLSARGTTLSLEPFHVLSLAGWDHGLYVGAAQRRHSVSVSGCCAPSNPFQQLLLSRAVGSRGGPPPEGPDLAARPPSRQGGYHLLDR
jgi:hypothetical protein